MEISDKRAKIAVIGLGNAGLPLAAVIADNGIPVLGVDINEERCRLINQGTNPIPEEEGLDELIRSARWEKVSLPHQISRMQETVRAS